MQTEADTMTDFFVMAILVVVYMFQNNTKVQNEKTLNTSEEKQEKVLRKEGERVLLKRQILSLIIICIVKFTYFFDREKSLNFQTDPKL